MPFAPAPVACSQETPSHCAGDPPRTGADTPCKIPRPLKRRRFACGPTGAGGPGEQLAVAAEGKCWAGLELALAVSFALLETDDIVRAAASCVVWRGVAECKTLWVLAAPRLGLAARIVRREEISRRRSRGIVLRGVLLGESRRPVALRSVDLRGANAGLDDGLLPTVVREVALLRTLGRLQHPGVVRLVGAEVVGEQVHIVTEFAASSFLHWFSRPRSPQARLRAEIRDRFGQLLQAVAFLHSEGVFHRNITPPNVLIDLPSGTVKLCDFACGRALDLPVRPYSPEDPKLRPQSTREARRLWYRAPELLLRQPAYGTAIDIWSVGTLMAEAARGEPIFPSESEVDHLFRIFRFTGSPGPHRWPQALTFPYFSPRFPVYEPADLRLAARVSRGVEAAEVKLRLALGKQRPDVLTTCLRCGAVLGINGSELLASMLQLDPQLRCEANVALTFAFLKKSPAASAGGSRCSRTRAPGLQPSESSAARGDQPGGSEQPHGPLTPQAPQELPSGLEGQLSEAAEAEAAPAASSQTQAEAKELGTPRTCVARGVARLRLGSPPGGGAPARLAGRKQDAPMASALWQAMTRLDASLRQGADAQRRLAGGGAATSWPLEDGHADARAVVVDYIVGLAGQVQVGDFGVHLAVALYDEERAASLGKDCMEPELAATACLKLADAFDEQSQEYYQRERAASYQQATRQRWPLSALLEAEKRVVQSIGFRSHRPTVAWFLRACASAGGRELVNSPGVIRLARFIADLSLLDAELQEHSPALRAQVALLVALHVSAPLETAQRLWLPVKVATCGGNAQEAAAACLGRTMHVLQTKREQWSARGLHAVERRHPEASRQTLLLRDVPKDVVAASLTHSEV